MASSYHGLDLLGAVMLVAARVPAPDAAARSPDLDGIGVLAEPAADGLAQIPGAIDLVAPRMRLFVLKLAAVVRVTVTGGAAEAQAGGVHARAGEHAVVDAVAHMDAKTTDLAHGGKAVGKAVVGLLHGNGLLLQERLHNPVGVVVGEVAREMQVGIDKAGHDRLARGVDDLVALIGRNVLVRAGVADLAVLLNKHERVLHRLSTGAVDELAAHDRVLLVHSLLL